MTGADTARAALLESEPADHVGASLDSVAVEDGVVDLQAGKRVIRMQLAPFTLVAATTRAATRRPSSVSRKASLNASGPPAPRAMTIAPNARPEGKSAECWQCPIAAPMLRSGTTRARPM